MQRFHFWVLVSVLLTPLAGYATEEGDLWAANAAIAADIAVRAHPKTRSLCAERPCLGVAQSELGLLLIAARDTRQSGIALAELIRFRLDGGLAEDYACIVAKKGIQLKPYVEALKPSLLRDRCVSEYTSVTRSQPQLFAASEAGLVCRSVEDVTVAKRELLSLLVSRRTCQE